VITTSTTQAETPSTVLAAAQLPFTGAYKTGQLISIAIGFTAFGTLFVVYSRKLRRRISERTSH
jgi:hypothetical protein